MSNAQHYADSAIAPARAPFAITPSDTERLPAPTKAIYVGTGGAVVVRGVDAAADVTYRNVPGGSYLIICASHVRASGTTAADLVGEA
jgi:hypothetical protein